MKLFADDEHNCEEQDKKFIIPPMHSKFIEPLYEIVKESRDACCFLPTYPLDAINEFLKYLVYYKDVSGVKARLFSEKYFDLGTGYTIDRLLGLWGDEKYFLMIAELKARQILNNNEH